MTIQITLNGETHTVIKEYTLGDLVGTLQISGQALAVAVNRRVIPRQKWKEYVLSPDDKVDIVRAIGGG